MVTLYDLIVVVVGDVAITLNLEVDGACVDITPIGLAIADDGSNAKPGKNGYLVAEIDGEGFVILP